VDHITIWTWLNGQEIPSIVTNLFSLRSFEENKKTHNSARSSMILRHPHSLVFRAAVDFDGSGVFAPKDARGCWQRMKYRRSKKQKLRKTRIRLPVDHASAHPLKG